MAMTKKQAAAINALSDAILEVQEEVLHDGAPMAFREQVKTFANELAVLTPHLATACEAMELLAVSETKVSETLN